MVPPNNQHDNNTSTEVDSTRIRQDPIVLSLLRHLPQNIADSYSDQQLIGIKMMLGDRVWNRHSIDLRGTFSLPFIMWRFYYVLLLGKNKRAFTRREKGISAGILVLVILCGISICAFLGILALYLLKSALGIDILPGTSTGIWTWFTR